MSMESYVSGKVWIQIGQGIQVTFLHATHLLKLTHVSQYRQKHAPNGLYLPSELNMKIMYDNLSENLSSTIMIITVILQKKAFVDCDERV